MEFSELLQRVMQPNLSDSERGRLRNELLKTAEGTAFDKMTTEAAGILGKPNELFSYALANLERSSNPGTSERESAECLFKAIHAFCIAAIIGLNNDEQNSMVFVILNKSMENPLTSHLVNSWINAYGGTFKEIFSNFI